MVCLQPVINTEKALELKFRMLDVLSDIEVAQVCEVACTLAYCILSVVKQELSSNCCKVGELAMCPKVLYLRPLDG